MSLLIRLRLCLKSRVTIHILSESSLVTYEDVDWLNFTWYLIVIYILIFSSYRIIHRRIIWLCGQWVGVKMSSSLRPTLYQAIISLLNQSEDLVVRIEAAMTLKTDILYHWFNENLNYIPVNAKKIIMFNLDQSHVSKIFTTGILYFL